VSAIEILSDRTKKRRSRADERERERERETSFGCKQLINESASRNYRARARARRSYAGRSIEAN